MGSGTTLAASRRVFKACHGDGHGGLAAVTGAIGAGVSEAVDDAFASAEAKEAAGRRVGEAAIGIDVHGHAPGAQSGSGRDREAGPDVVGKHAGRGADSKRRILIGRIGVGDGGAVWSDWPGGSRGENGGEGKGDVRDS